METNVGLKTNGPALPREDWLPAKTERRIGRILMLTILFVTIVVVPLRLWNFTYDVPPSAPLLGFPGTSTDYAWDSALYGDEGFYANDAISFAQTGQFHVDLDYNQYINLPLMQFIKGWIFAIFGISLYAARMTSFIGAVGTVAAIYYLVRRYEDHSTALLASYFVAINHFFFAFSRYAIDEVPVTFLVTLTFALAVRVRGDKWLLFAILTAVVYACALLTKTNAIFATPLIGALVISQELEWKKILLKFALCSAVFLSIMATWYLWLVVPHLEEYRYFFTLNVGITSSEDVRVLWEVFKSQIDLVLLVDPMVNITLLLATPLLMLLSARYRVHPLMYLSLSWTLLYMAMYAYYGRFYPRFFSMTVPPMALWIAISLRYFLDLRGPFRLATYAFVALLAWSSVWQLHRVVSILAYGKNTWNEMATDILRIVDEDPSGNRVVMGHSAASLALRTGLIPRHDRYGAWAPLKERLEFHKPGWVLSGGELRIMPLKGSNELVEWYDLLFDMKLVASYDILENFRGYKMHLYKLTPRGNVQYPPPVVRARMPERDSAGEDVP